MASVLGFCGPIDRRLDSESASHDVASMGLLGSQARYPSEHGFDGRRGVAPQRLGGIRLDRSQVGHR